MQKTENTDEYIASFPQTTQKYLKQLRKLIVKTAPQAKELISYGIPSYKIHGMIVHFAAYEKHIGLYPGPDAIAAFQSEIKPYKTSKGTIQFPIDTLPLKLIENIVRFNLEQDQEKAQLAAEKKTAKK